MSDEIEIPSVEEIASFQWEGIAAGVAVPTAHNIADRLFMEAGALFQAGHHIGEKVCRFIGRLAYLRIDPPNADDPLQPLLFSRTSRSPGLGEHDASALDIIVTLATTTAFSALRARFSDILWLAQKDHKMALQAATEYLNSFKAIESIDNWVDDIDGLRRGMTIAYMLGRKRPLFNSYLSFIENRLASLETTCGDAYAASLFDLLLEHRAGDRVKAAKIAETIGDRLTATNSGSLGRDYYDQAIQFFHANKDLDGVQRAGLKKGESLLAQATASIGSDGTGYFTASHHLSLAIECLSQAKASEDRIKELHKLLAEWQEKSTGELKTFSHEADITPMVDAARKTVAGKSFQDAVIAMALGHPPINVKTLEKRVLDSASKHPFSSIFGASVMDRRGRIMAHRPSGLTTNADELQQYVTAEMFQQAQLDWALRAQGYIEICRSEIVQEHHPRLQDLHFLILHNPFIPPGHENIFLKGVLAGFRAEYDIAAHLLVPQIEECIRHVLQQAGHVTSKFKGKLIQQERLLGTLLGMPETEELFTPNHVFELKGLLCEKFGCDLRNRLAHGFLSYQECWSVEVVNLWWLTLRLLSIPVARSRKEAEKQVSDPISSPPDHPDVTSTD